MQRIRAKRRELGMTMKQLGAIVGVSEAAISHYENGRREPDPNMLGLLANALGVTVDYLMGREVEPAQATPEGEKIGVMFRTDAPNYYSRLNAANKALIEDLARKLFESQKNNPET